MKSPNLNLNLPAAVYERERNPREQIFFTSFYELNLSPESKQKNKISPLMPIFHASLFPLAGIGQVYAKTFMPMQRRNAPPTALFFPYYLVYNNAPHKITGTGKNQANG